ncbi:glycosyltransferase family 2 protein [bacterium]|nr:glycosyltransferase family 2 protein [bacterium]
MNRTDKDRSRQIYLMLPMYNEQEAIVALLDNIEQVRPSLKEPFSVVIVDDGSDDNSVPNIKKYMQKNPLLPITLLRHTQNMGLGQAMRTGIYHLAKKINHNDIVFTMDADNTHNPQYMPDMIKKVDKENDIVIASRYCEGGEEKGLSMHRSFLSLGASGLLKICFRCKGVRDYTCGFRAYRGRVIKEAYDAWGEKLICENGFTCMAELLIKTHHFAKKVDEVPMILRYDLKCGASKMKVLRTIMRYMHLITNLKRSALKTVSGK